MNSFKSGLVTALALVGLPFAASAEACALVDAVDAYAATNSTPAGAECALYQAQDGATGVSCHWTHAFRDAGAVEQAGGIWEDLTACRAGGAASQDVGVNHPDSYDNREGSGAEARYWVSVKDKGALNRTLVFLRRVAMPE